MRMRILCFMVGGLACLSVSAAEEKWWYSYDAIKIGIMDVASDRERLYGVQLCLCDFGDALRPIEAKKWYRHQVDGCVISLAHSIERCRGVSLGLINMTEEGYGLSIGLLPGSYHHTGVQIGALNWFWLGHNPRLMFGYRVTGMQCGIVNVSSDTSCFQAGALNLNGSDFGDERCSAQIGLVNLHEKTGTAFQIGGYNRVWIDTQWMDDDDVTPLIQIGVVNQKNAYQKWGLQIGVLNEVRNGLWIPVSNFGL